MKNDNKVISVLGRLFVFMVEFVVAVESGCVEVRTGMDLYMCNECLFIPAHLFTKHSWMGLRTEVCPYGCLSWRYAINRAVT